VTETGKRAIRYAPQAVVSRDAAVGEYRRIEAHAIIPHAQPELLVVISDLDFDTSGMRVPIGIPQKAQSIPGQRSRKTLDLLSLNYGAGFAERTTTV
jgi:hypothetical protein